MSDRFGVEHDPQARKEDVAVEIDCSGQTLADEKSGGGWTNVTKPFGQMIEAASTSSTR